MQFLRVVSAVALIGCGVGSESGPNTDESTQSDESKLVTGISTNMSGCPGANWLEGVQSWSGLSGTFYRLDVPATGEFSKMTVTGSENALRYSRTVGFTSQTGVLVAGPDNPAVGPGLVFYDNAGEARDFYFTPWIRRSAVTGNVVAICALSGVTSTGFVLKRFF